MKKCNKLAALALAALALSACCDQASIRGTLADAPGRTIAVKQLDINTFRNLDSVKVAADGSFSYRNSSTSSTATPASPPCSSRRASA